MLKLTADGRWSPQFNNPTDIARHQRGSGFAVSYLIYFMSMMTRQWKQWLINGSITLSFGNGPDEQTMIEGRSYHQFVIITGKISNFGNGITRSIKLHLVRYFIGWWSLPLFCWHVVDNLFFLRNANQTISFPIESGAISGRSGVEWMHESK